ncbi:MAG TPA: response regulator [Microvirga sp.]|nr:response regulator [Microvirga sp.]
MNAAKVTRLRPEAPPTLLLVEDDVVTRFMLADELRACGFKVLEASNAEDALTILESVPVHLVFADIHIPGRSGLEVARVARTLRPAPHIILTSGKVREEDIPDAQAFGLFIQKPYVLSRVVEIVRRTLDPTARC